jgi:hypothetical protein
MPVALGLGHRIPPPVALGPVYPLPPHIATHQYSGGVMEDFTSSKSTCREVAGWKGDTTGLVGSTDAVSAFCPWGKAGLKLDLGTSASTPYRFLVLQRRRGMIQPPGHFHSLIPENLLKILRWAAALSASPCHSIYRRTRLDEGRGRLRDQGVNPILLERERERERE